MSDEKDNEPSGDRRASPRIPVEMWVEESTDRELYFQRGANISAGGIFLERTIPHSKGTVVNLQFTLPDENTPIKVKGEIVNVGDDPTELGMGVKFVDLDDNARKQIERFIERASDTEEGGDDPQAGTGGPVEPAGGANKKE